MFQQGSLWAGLASGAMTQFQHTREYTAGVEYGAMLGTAVKPGFGTAAGAILGAVLGDKVGRAVGQQTGQMIFNREPEAQQTAAAHTAAP